MGYRHYFYLVDIAECDAVKNMAYEDLVEYAKAKHPNAYEVYGSDDSAEEFLNFHELLGQREIFEFGKLYYDDTADRIYSHGEPLFADKGTKAEFADYHPYRMGKKAMREAIEIYKEKIISYYKDVLVDGAVQVLPLGIEINRDDIKSMDKLIDHVKDEIMWWEKLGVIDMDEENERISKSWMYEHQIFELVRLYKSIDWDSKCLLFYGY